MVEARAMKLTMVPVTNTDEGWRAVRVALTMARRFEGHVGAVFIQPHIEVEIPEFLPAVDKDLRVQLADRAREDMAARIRQAHNTFDEIAAVFEVPVQDKPPAAGDVVRMRASVYDAVIFAHPVGKAHADWRPSVEAALFSAGRPALIAPSTDVETVGETVLVGWNRSAQSARAMIGAMPFLTRASRVVIFSIATGAKEGPSPQDAARLLSWHGVAAEVVEIPPEDGPVAETILAKGREVGADLVVIGASSHRRFREIILGGVTQHVLRHAAVPVLMAH
jgi:nucleotide-binding universal stress UspA family protein